jgi:hypothetical protein
LKAVAIGGHASIITSRTTSHCSLPRDASAPTLEGSGEFQPELAADNHDSALAKGAWHRGILASHMLATLFPKIRSVGFHRDVSRQATEATRETAEKIPFATLRLGVKRVPDLSGFRGRRITRGIVPGSRTGTGAVHSTITPSSRPDRFSSRR